MNGVAEVAGVEEICAEFVNVKIGVDRKRERERGEVVTRGVHVGYYGVAVPSVFTEIAVYCGFMTHRFRFGTVVR
jgi:hypothetical protein